MSLLLPLGLLGLAGIGVLLLIYLLRPNYQQKVVSSTYLWKLSLKRRKKKLPISRLRNILLIICQVLIVIACALILAKPATAVDARLNGEKVIVIDASASMRVGDYEDNRFERAVKEATELSNRTLSAGGLVSVILAGDQATTIAQRLGVEGREDLLVSFDNLLKEDACTYGAADIDGAMVIAGEICAGNATAEVVLYTGKRYLNPNGVTVVDVSKEEEWNAAILDVHADNVENRYEFSADVASYGAGNKIGVTCIVHNYNFSNNNLQQTVEVPLEMDGEETVSFKFMDGENREMLISSYEYVEFRLDADDDLPEDNVFNLYGGEKQTIKVEYVSAVRRSYFQVVVRSLRYAVSSRWNIEIDEKDASNYSLEGYDFYIFEQMTPSYLPTDGVVWLMNPTGVPEGGEFVLGGNVTRAEGKYLTAGEAHPVMDDKVIPEEILITRYTQVESYADYIPLMYCDDDPVVLLRNSVDNATNVARKVILVTFGFDRSDLSLNQSFAMLFLHTFDYFIPSTVKQYSANANESVQLNARGTELTVESGQGERWTLKEFPASFRFTVPGYYGFSQTLLSGVEISEDFYVRIPKEECNINRTVDVLKSPDITTERMTRNADLLIWFAIALEVLLFAEWFLHTRERI